MEREGEEGGGMKDREGGRGMKETKGGREKERK